MTLADEDTNWILTARSINLPSTASMEGGTLLFEGAHLIDAIRAFVAKQANVLITLFFLANIFGFDSIVPHLNIEFE